VTIDDPDRVANKADDPMNGAGMGGCPWLKAINCTRAPWRTDGFYCPGERSDDVFIAPRVAPFWRSKCPGLEHLRGALSHEYRKPAFEGTRERNQAAGISEISGFSAPAPGPARRAIGAQAFSFSLIAAKLSRTGTEAARAHGRSTRRQSDGGETPSLAGEILVRPGRLC
jgi:hypothetical protein